MWSKSPTTTQKAGSVTTQKIAILDFGGQYTQLIARRIRELGVYSEILPCTEPVERVLAGSYTGLVLSGGPSSVYEDDAPLPDKRLLESGIPMLGICYGMQAMGYLMGGHVVPAERREYGKAHLRLLSRAGLLGGVEPEADGLVTVWMSHGDTVLKPPPGFKSLAATDNCPVAAMADPARRLFAVQFHPEVAHTPQGKTVLKNFLDAAGVTGDWSMPSFVESAVEGIRRQVGKDAVLCALSGGVDSSVVAALIHRAVGDQLTCLFVDNGLLRKGEVEGVVRTFRDTFKMKLIHVDASKRFIDRLDGVTDPEVKRKTIGAEFIAVFEDEARKLGHIPWLAQGTLYPDVIESVSFKGPSATIKTHHNVGGLPSNMRFKLVEPLRELFKDEVRELGAVLGLPAEIIWRQPFPGPGLAIRVLGEVTEERLALLREADAIVQDEVRQAGLERQVWQAFAVLLPVRTVGVMGDFRTYAQVIALRAVTSQDAMTADWARLPYDLLGRISNRIINEVQGVNRVVYDISSKPPSTIEWE
jgi:GMP synthase (glutamine-hydrolysing)